MLFYVFKADEGYIKYSDEGNIQIVPLDKASVFPTLQNEYMQKVTCDAEKVGLTNIRIAKLELTETDFYSKRKVCCIE
ncbi:MAG: hypothetical protein JJT76_14825 [Clostridiaceae bacterium]|nr:hypothetical protein [Clostridiaceae bacterium]